MPLQTIEPRRLYRQIAEQLRGLIRGGEYPVGARLPPERDLALQLRVSRPSVREALIALEVEGLVEVRMGSGIYVIAPEPDLGAARVEAELSPFEIIRARQLIECELAALAAGSAKTGDIVRGLRDALDLMEADIARELMPTRGDRLFHVRVAEASENGALLRVVTDLYDQRNNPLFERLGRHFERVDTWREAVTEHRGVVAAIAAQDPARARAAMHEHLQRSHDRFGAAWAGGDPAIKTPAEQEAA
jgi:DNA-binding FadR family transcriptional regulator